MKFEPKKYQLRAIHFGLSNPNAALFLDMGLGKTVITLTVIKILLNRCEARGVLIVAPKRVCELVWRQEAEKWDHTRRIKISLCVGSWKDIEKMLATRADIYLINYEHVINLSDWINRNEKRLPFDMVVWDESSKMKSASARRFKMMKPYLRHFHRSLILTGTPAANSYLNLWSQIFLLDRGERLTPFITHFKERYFRPVDRNFYEWKLIEGADRAIEEKIADITLAMKAEDWLDMPKLAFNEIKVELPEKARALYKEFEDEMFFELENKKGVEALNAASLSAKCRQLTSGAVYHEDKTWSEIHTAKMDALEDFIEDVQGSPLIVAYEFRHELARIRKLWPNAPVIGGGTKGAEKIVEDWNAKRIPVLFVHPASIGHGVNLQYGGNAILFTSSTWDLELFEQTYKRLYRQGQSRPVMVHTLVCPGTVDLAVQSALRTKAKGQNALMQALQGLRG